MVPCNGSCLQLCPQTHHPDRTPCLCSLPCCKHCYDGRTSSSLGTQHQCTPSWLQNMISKCHCVCHWALLSRQPSSPLLRRQVSSPIQLFRSGRSATFCCQPAISMTPFLLQDRLNINTAICILGRVGGGWGGRHNPFLIYRRDNVTPKPKPRKRSALPARGGSG